MFGPSEPLLVVDGLKVYFPIKAGFFAVGSAGCARSMASA